MYRVFLLDIILVLQMHPQKDRQNKIFLRTCLQMHFYIPLLIIIHRFFQSESLVSYAYGNNSLDDLCSKHCDIISKDVYGTINHSKFYPNDTTTMYKKKKENTHNISFTDLEQILDGSVWIVKAGSQCSNHLVSLEPHGHDLHHHVLVLLAGDQHALGRHLARGL